MRGLMVWILLAAAPAAAADIHLAGPGGPIEVREYTQIMVTGLAIEDLPAAVVTATPAEGVLLLPARLWGGAPFILFSARRPGRYEVRVTLHGWRRRLDEAITEATTAQVASADLAELVAVAERLAAAYPQGAGAITLDVLGEDPPDPPPPVGAPAVAIVHQAEHNHRLTPERLKALYSRNVRRWATEHRLPLVVIDPDPGGPDRERLEDWDVYFQASAGADLPAVVVLDEATGQVVTVAPLPADEAALLEFLETLLER